MSIIKKLSELSIQIVESVILFSLSFSGLMIALILRHFKFNGIIITLFGIIVELIAIALLYFYFKKYLSTEEEPPQKEKKGKK
ncbi:MAG: hypothetical protein EU539_11455 [Promethearchaeota archaeon]|nr:MAG: hypothetical protein EU539_11455 [Candidatus Lokiarchaeota archaeon]